MHLPDATLIIPLYASLPAVVNVPKQTSDSPFIYSLKGDLVDGVQPVNLTWNATTKIVHHNHKPSQGRSEES
ncbi:unnamed protein product [Tuber melanosporum]|uniref:(Perigord truffle) hypothetical protein n=1 Tax=Tuber melanosporum (strain Mel28) TaxID=656061 RepID=D5GC17_TUBMM|nr:uncharacterized protein GSTUM_00005769001 [Tuber melanosporum]CAZ82060.1 unnamed protein product [Tuber melanosporum]